MGKCIKYILLPSKTGCLYCSRSYYKTFETTEQKMGISSWNFNEISGNMQLMIMLKVLRQPKQNFWPKILTPYFYYSNLYLTFLRSCCENIVKIVCIVSEKTGKQMPQFSVLSLASIPSCLQFRWNRKYFSSGVLRLLGRLFISPWHGFHLFAKER